MKHLRQDGTVGEVDVMSTPLPSEDDTRVSTMHSFFDRDTGERIGGVETISLKFPRPQ